MELSRPFIAQSAIISAGDLLGVKDPIPDARQLLTRVKERYPNQQVEFGEVVLAVWDIGRKVTKYSGILAEREVFGLAKSRLQAQQEVPIAQPTLPTGGLG